MAAVYKYILNVKFLSGCKFQDIFTKTKDAIKGIGKENVVYKVTGENSMIAVTDDRIDDVLAAVNQLGGDLDITSTPLRIYENFAKGVLGLEEGGFETDLGKLVKDGHHTFWLDVDVKYTGITTKDLLSNWRQEAKLVLAGTKAGLMNIVPYKTVGVNQVHVFISVPNGDALDDALFGLPLVQSMGNNLSVKCKHVQML